MVIRHRQGRRKRLWFNINYHMLVLSILWHNGNPPSFYLKVYGLC